MTLPRPEQRAAITAEEARECVRLSHGITVDPATGCWYWAWPDADTGYGPFRAFYVATFGEPPATLEPTHTCGGGARGCVRPDHLDLVSAAGAGLQDLPTPTERTWFAERLQDELDARSGHERLLAAELDVPPSRLARWLAGRGTPTVDDLRRCSTRLGWDETPRRWVISYLGQVVVDGPSAGDAVRQARALVTPPGQAPKMRVVEARKVE